MSASSVAKAGSMEGHWFDGSNKLSKPSCSFWAIAYIITSVEASANVWVSRTMGHRRARGEGERVRSLVGWLAQDGPSSHCVLRSRVVLIAVAGRSHPQRRPPARVDVRQHVHRDPVGPEGRVDLGRHRLGREPCIFRLVVARR